MATRIGLVGHGRWGRNIEKTLEALGATCVTIDQEVSEEIDGVCIATPSATHAEVALPFIEKGIATFIEKPIATSSLDAERIREAANRTGVLVQVGHIHTHNPAFLTLHELVPRIGEIRMASFEHLYATPRTDSSVFWDCLPHTFSMAYKLFGSIPENIQAWSFTQTPTGLTESGAVLAHINAVSIFSEVSWLSPIKRTALALVGTSGSLFFEDTNSEGKKVALHTQDGVTYPRYNAEPPLTREMRAFIDAIQKGDRSDSSLTEALNIVRAIEAAEESSHAQGASISLRT